MKVNRELTKALALAACNLILADKTEFHYPLALTADGQRQARNLIGNAMVEFLNTLETNLYQIAKDFIAEYERSHHEN